MSQGGPLSLWGATVSPSTRKVRIVLEFKGLAYKYPPEQQTLPASFLRGMGKGEKEIPPILFEASRLGRVPVLETVGLDGKRFLLDESEVIIDYLERRFPSSPSVYPSESPELYALAAWWHAWVDSRLQPVVHYELFKENVVKPLLLKQTTNLAAVEKALKELEPLLKDLETALKDGRKWLVGGRVTVADLALAAHYANHEAGKWDVDRNKYPNVVAYLTRLMDLPAVKAAL
mmetsp:Transcript_40277/g.65287  ORF Transcript_40277/g.65287 Transcript_40277/m.65287 type:complete len:232 (+) Transcript_40277:215-910(+)